MRTEGRPVTVSGYVTCAAVVTDWVASQTAWCQYCLSRMTTDYLHLSLPAHPTKLTLNIVFIYEEATTSALNSCAVDKFH